MDKFKEIRPVVLGLVRRNNKILVSEGHDKNKNETFYRCLGGGVEFLEKSQDALKREFKEELGIDIYKEKYHVIDDNSETDAMWVDIDKFKNRKLKIYPEEIFEYLK